MGPKLKEDPKEWMKFTAAAAVALGALTVLLWKRRIVSQTLLTLALVSLSLALFVCLVRPAWFRGFYRVGMTVGFLFGRLVGCVLLAIFFWLVLSPLALLLRLLGKDLLAMKWRTSATTYWHTAKVSDQFDRLF